MFKLLLLFSDILLFAVSVFLVLVLRNFDINMRYYLDNLMTFAPLFPAVVLIFYVFSIYDAKRLREYGLKKTIVLVFGICVFAGFAFFYLFSDILHILTPKITLIGTFLIYCVLVYFSRKLYIKIKDKGVFLVENVLIAGTSATIGEIKTELFKTKEYNLVMELKTLSEKEFSGGGVDRKDIDFAIVPAKYLFGSDRESWNFLSKEFLNKGITVKTDFDFYEYLLRKIPRESIDQGFWILKTMAGREEMKVDDVLERAFDLTTALLCAVIALVPSVLTWLTIKFIYGYEPVFKQRRVGYFGEIFYIYKFRTMKPKEKEVTEIFNEYASEQNEYFFLGKILRRFRLDEIPQIINILKGDLSFVGPRPVWDEEFKLVEKEIMNYSIRNTVRPGIAGWAQLNFRAVRNMDDCKERFAYDIYYIKNKSLFLNISILLKTAKRLFVSDKTIKKQ